MRRRSRCLLTLGAALLGLSPLASARAQFSLFDEVYVPTSAVYVEPTSTVVVPTSTVTYLPTVSVVRARPLYTQTTYVPSSLWAPTSYVIRPTTTLLTPTVWRPTTWVVPTSTTTYLRTSATSDACCGGTAIPTVETRIVAPSDSCCDSGTTISDATVISDRPVTTAPAASDAKDTTESGRTEPPASRESEPEFNHPGALISEPQNRTTAPASTPPALPPTPPASSAGASDSIPSPAAATPIPPEQPAPAAVTPGQLPADPGPGDLPGSAPLPDPAAAPGGGTPLVDPTTHQARRPAFTDPAVQPAAATPTSARTTLRGRVLSASTGAPETGLTVTLVDARARFKDREVRTDATGAFSAVLPEGDWTVKVTRLGAQSSDPNATIDTPVTVSGGVVTDRQDREVTTLTINR
jgi:hypothetical protein